MKGAPIIAIAFGLLFAGCSPVTLKTVTLSPSQGSWPIQVSYSQGFWCQGLNTFGAYPPVIGSVGYEDAFSQGPPPFGCQQEQQVLYRIQVAFDLSQFDTITDATLNFDVDQSFEENDWGVTNQIPPVSYATTIGMSTGTRDDGNGPYFWDFDNSVSMPWCGSLIQPNCTLNVSREARAWAANSHPNFGFILAGPILDFPNSLPQDNNGAGTLYNDFQLEVIYNPAQNPRAPQ